MRPGPLNKLWSKMGGDVFILLFSLFLAFFMWSMHRFTLEYSSMFEYRVNLASNLEGRSKSAESHNALVVRGQTSGFYIIQQQLGKWFGGESVDIFMDARWLRSSDGSKDLFSVAGNEMKQLVQDALGPDFKLESIASDTLYFTFPRQAYKKVPVVPVYEITYEPQYATTMPVAIRPDSVLIYGEASKLAQIDSVFTQKIRRKMVNAPVQGVVQLQPVNGVRYSTKELFYAIDVQRYYESIYDVKVSPVNTPQHESRFIFYPQNVSVTYRAVYGGKPLKASDFSVKADFSEREQCNGREIIKLRCTVSKPAGVFSVKVEPKYVECFSN